MHNSSSFQNNSQLYIRRYESDRQLPRIMRLIEADLSEPYTIYTYRYFIHQWPSLCFLAFADTAINMSSNPTSSDKPTQSLFSPDDIIGVVICKYDDQKQRGYIGMLAIDPAYRKCGIGSLLVKSACHEMHEMNAIEVVLETELCNAGALRLYERLGFIRDKRLIKYYQNGQDAFRLKLWLKPRQDDQEPADDEVDHQ